MSAYFSTGNHTDEGNVILSLKGNVEELRDAYKEAQKEAYKPFWGMSQFFKSRRF